METVGEIADYREAEEAPVVSISTKATEQRDWFDLGIQISLEGQPVSFAAVFSALASGQTKMLLPSGAYFSLDLPELHQLRALIEEARSLQDNKDAPLQISRFQAGLWDELAQLGIVDQQAAAWRSAVGGLLEGGVDGLPLPASLNAELRPYQLEGYNWLSFLYKHGLGGILADDMGLGKTVQALALMCAAKVHAAEVAGADSNTRPAAVAPFLVVAPTSVVGNWAAEAARFAPGLTVRTVGETFGKSGQDVAEALGGADVVITSYALFRIDYEAYASRTWAALVLDEAQFVKNHQSKAYQCARKLPAAFKLAITGTPLENNLMEFWALTSIVAPGLFSSPKRFAEYYQKPVEKNGDKGQLEKLRRRVRPLMMRRTKDQVIKDLPPKQEQVLEVVLNPRHQKIYQTHLQRERQKILGLIEDVNKNRFTIFQSLTLLRQLSLDVSLVDPALSAVRSSKLDVLFEQLEDLVAEGHRALIFSQFTGFLGKVRERLDDENIEYCYLDGGTRNRADVVSEFKNGKAPVFLISLKAGGFGLNLTEADYVFLLDPWWNPASEAQAVDRTHRIGQARNVMVYRLVAKDTIEEKVMALKTRKSQLFADVMEGDALAGGAITAEDLAGLFKSRTRRRASGVSTPECSSIRECGFDAQIPWRAPHIRRTGIWPAAQLHADRVGPAVPMLGATQKYNVGEDCAPAARRPGHRCPGSTAPALGRLHSPVPRSGVGRAHGPDPRCRPLEGRVGPLLHPAARHGAGTDRRGVGARDRHRRCEVFRRRRHLALPGHR